MAGDRDLLKVTYEKIDIQYISKDVAGIVRDPSGRVCVKKWGRE